MSFSVRDRKLSYTFREHTRVYRDYVVGLVITLAILVVETIAIVLNMDKLRITSIHELAHDHVKLIVYSSYVLSIILIPALVLWSFSAARDLIEMYRRLSLKSLGSISTSWIRRSIWLVPPLTALSLTSILLSIIIGSHHTALLSLLPLIPFVTAILKPVIDVHNHKRLIDIELKWFVIVLSIIEGVGTNIGFLIEKLKKSPLLRSIAKEMTVVDRDSRLYFISHVDALLYRARATPSERLARILLGYASKIREGGDILQWLRTRIDEEILRSEFSMKLYAERVAVTVSQLALAIYTILPLIAVSTSMVLSMNFVIAIAILTTPLLISITYSIRPKTLNTIPVKYIIGSHIAFIALSITLYNFIGGYSLAISWLVGIVVGYRAYRTISDAEILDRDSLEILKNVIELRRGGYSVVKSLEYIVQSSALNRVTLRNLEVVLNRVSQGYSLAEVGAGIGVASFLFRYTVFILGVIHECGGGSEEVLQSLYENVYRIKIMENSIRKLSLLFEIFSIANVFIMVWIWRTVSPLISALNMHLSAGVEIFPITILIFISLVCFKLISSVIKRGVPLFEPKDCVAIAVGILASNLIH